MSDNSGQGISSPDFLRGQIKQTGPDKLKAPDNIIQTIQGAKAVYYQYRTEHLRRIDIAAQIEGLIAGNPPYNPSELASKKLSHIANFNDLSARSRYEKAALAYWNLLNEAEFLCKFTILPTTDSELTQYAEIMSKNWTSVVRSWPSFNVVFNTLVGQLVKFGLASALWPDERDWRWRTIEYARFFVEDQAQADIDLLTCICVESVFTAQYLFQVYNEYKDMTSKAHGEFGKWDYDVCPWNIDELSKLLLFKANQFAKTDFQFFDLMDIQKRIQNGDLTFNAIFTDNLRIVSELYKEYDGKITHMMFDRTYDGGDFLYKANRQYECMEEAVVIFTASPGETTLHSNRGLGHKIFSASQALMQLNCSITDMARMSATPLIKSPALASKDMEAIRFYPGVPTHIGTAEFVENTLGANISQLIQASQYIDNKLQVNTANSGDDPSIPDSNVGSISPSQARMQSYKEFGLLKNNIAHFYTQFDLVVANMTAKLLRSKKGYPGYEYAKRWKELCIEDGVPEAMFSLKDSDEYGMPKHLSVRATRVAGDGSTLAKIMGLQELMPIMGSFGPRGVQNYNREWVMSTMGAEYVPEFLSDAGSPDESAGGASLAGVENSIMKQGESPIFSPDNEQRSHFATHMALGNDIIQKMQQQQMDAIQADKVFSVLIPHMQDHFEALKRSPFTQTFVEGVKKPWNQLLQYATLNRHKAGQMLQAQLKKQQELEEQNQQVLSEEELKNMKARGDEERANKKVDSQIERAREANVNRADIMREKVVKDSDNKRLQVQLEANNKSTEIAATESTAPELRSEIQTMNGTTPAPYDFE